MSVCLCPSSTRTERGRGVKLCMRARVVTGGNIGPFWFRSESVSGAVPGAAEWPDGLVRQEAGIR